MDDIQRAIDWIKEQKLSRCENCLRKDSEYCSGNCRIENDVYKTAISAMQELQQYRELEEKLKSQYGECDGLLVQVVDTLVQHSQEYVQGQPIKARLLTDEDVDRWDQYRQIGTPEECREAR